MVYSRCAFKHYCQEIILEKENNCLHTPPQIIMDPSNLSVKLDGANAINLF